MPTAVFWENIARCTFPTIRFTTRSFISLPAIGVFRIFRRNTENRRADLLGSVVPRRLKTRSAQRRASYFLSHQHRRHPHEKAEFGTAQLDAWRTIQRAHAIANGVTSAVVNRVGFEGKQTKVTQASNSGQLFRRRSLRSNRRGSSNNKK